MGTVWVSLKTHKDIGPELCGAFVILCYFVRNSFDQIAQMFPEASFALQTFAVCGGHETFQTVAWKCQARSRDAARGPQQLS